MMDTVEKGLDSRDRSCIGAVLVDLELQKRLADHLLLEKMSDEGIGAASEIRDVNGKELLVFPDKFRRGHDFLTRSPVEVLLPG